MSCLRKINLKTSSGSWKAWASNTFGLDSPLQWRKSLVLKKKQVRNNCEQSFQQQKGMKFLHQRLDKFLVVIWWDSRADPLSWERLWACCFGVWCTSHQEDRLLSKDRGFERTNVPAFGWQTWSLRATVTVPLEGEIELSCFYLRTHPAQLETTSIKLRLCSCSHTAFQLPNCATGAEKTQLEAVALHVTRRLTHQPSSPGRLMAVFTNHNLLDTLCKT